jgi:DNA-binding NarL/FixJ family response regulator
MRQMMRYFDLLAEQQGEMPNPAAYVPFTAEIEEFEGASTSTAPRHPLSPENLHLTQSQKNVLVAFCHAESVEEVAKVLGTDPRRIRFVVEMIGRLLGVRTIHRMVAICIARQWINPHL